MKIGTMLSDVAGSLFHQPVTQRYPYERLAAPERLRGKLVWHPENCTGCGMCATDCPSGALEMVVIDKKAKRFVLQYYVDRCTFCAQCVYTCMRNSLEMDEDAWELAGFHRESFLLQYGSEEDIEYVLAGKTAEDS
jgi:formate hydrogenlyase subunit 6/NADH:ubiquinone oxidoreductase subunit I